MARTFAGGHVARTIALIHVALLTVFVFGYGTVDSLMMRLDGVAYDRFLRLRGARPVSPDIALVVMDAASVRRLGPTPWPRSVHARLLDRLHAAGVKAVGFDVAFVGPSDDPHDDEALRKALLRHPDTALVVDPLPDGSIVKPDFPAWLAVPYVTETGSMVREAPLTGSGELPGLGVEVARLHSGFSRLASDVQWAAVFGLPEYRPPWAKEIRVLISFPGTPVPHWSFVDVLDGKVAGLKGRSVIVCSASDVRDEFKIPLESAAGPFPAKVPGGEVHAYVAHTLLSGDVLRPTGPARWLLLAAVAILCAAVAMGPRRWRLMGYAAVVLAIWTLSAFVFTRSSHWLPPMVASLFVALSYVAVTVEERRRTRRVFEQVLPGSVVHQALTSQAFLAGEGHKVDVTVLFSDIRGYTTISERMDPTLVSSMLDDYHRAMDPAFEAFGGTVFDYQGDAQMVVFGDPTQLPNHAAAAVRAAVRMREVFAGLMERWEAEGRTTFDMGIGLCSGEVQVQMVGGTKKQYVAIGDTTNVAARLQGMSAQLGTPVLVSAATYERARGALDGIELEPLHEVELKGKSDRVMVYRVKGL